MTLSETIPLLEYAGVDPEMDSTLNWKKLFETFLFYITLNSHGIRQSQCGNAATVLTDVNVNSYKLHFPFIRGLWHTHVYNIKKQMKFL